MNIAQNKFSQTQESIHFVNRWEDLPNGKWLPNDENGIHWYLDIKLESGICLCGFLFYSIILPDLDHNLEKR